MLAIRKPTGLIWKSVLPAICILLVLGGYEWLSYRQTQINPKQTTLPTLAQMCHGFVETLNPDSSGKRWLIEDTKATMFRYVAGVGTGVLLSLVLGIAMGCFTPVEHFFLPMLSFLTKVPPTATIAVFFVMIGTDIKLFIALVAFGVLPTLTQAIYQAAKYDVPDELIEKTYSLGGSNMEVILLVIYPMILPRIIEFVRLQVGPAMVYLIAAEWMLGDVGFGYRLKIQSRLLNMAVVYDYIFLLGMAGYMADWLLTLVREKWCAWFGKGD